MISLWPHMHVIDGISPKAHGLVLLHKPQRRMPRSDEIRSIHHDANVSMLPVFVSSFAG